MKNICSRTQQSVGYVSYVLVLNQQVHYKCYTIDVISRLSEVTCDLTWLSTNQPPRWKPPLLGLHLRTLTTKLLLQGLLHAFSIKDVINKVPKAVRLLLRHIG